MIQTREKLIDSHNFTVTQLTAMRGMKLFARIGKAAGPALAQILGSPELDRTRLAWGFSALCGSLTDAELEHMTWELLSASTMDGTDLSKQRFDQELAGNYLLISKLLGFALEVNFGDFFGELVNAVRNGKASTRSESNSTTK